MEWIFFAFTAAWSLATADAITKKSFGDLSAYEMGLTRLVYTVPWLLASLFFIPRPSLDTTYFLSILTALPLEAVAFLCYMKAIKISPLSLTLPFLAFTPLFIILTGWLILGERITAPGFLGIAAIVIGAYIINLSLARTGMLEPFKAIVKERGSRLMLLVSFIYSITSTLGKLGVTHSSPSFFGVSYYLAFTFFIVILMPLVHKGRPANLLKNPGAGILLGAFMSLMIFSHMISISMVQAAYMVSVKRTSILFGMLSGAWLFKEERMTERFFGAVMMILGAFLIGCFG